MADEPAEEEKPKSNKMIVIILIAIIILLIGGGGAAFFMMSGGGDDKKDASAEQPQAEGENGAATEPGGEGSTEEAGGAVAPVVKGLGSTVELDPFIVNLKSNGGPDRYLKSIIVLVLSNEPVKEEITNRIPQIKDSIITVLSSKSAEEVLSIQGKFDLKVAMIKRINAVISTGVVRELFFTEFVVQ